MRPRTVVWIGLAVLPLLAAPPLRAAALDPDKAEVQAVDRFSDAAAMLFQLREGKAELVAAVAAPRTEHVAGQASRMQPHGNGLCEIWLAHDHSNRSAAQPVPENDKTRQESAGVAAGRRRILQSRIDYLCAVAHRFTDQAGGGWAYAG